MEPAPPPPRQTPSYDVAHCVQLLFLNLHLSSHTPLYDYKALSCQLCLLKHECPHNGQLLTYVRREILIVSDAYRSAEALGSGTALLDVQVEAR